MYLRGIYFPPALGASGVQGFFGDERHPEYQHSLLLKGLLGDIFEGIGFVAKTATADPNKGNVELSSKNGFSFEEVMPKAIHVFFFKGAALNAVGLSNPGFEFLLKTGIWQERREPFMLSFMPVGKTAEERKEETKKIVFLLKNELENFNAKIAMQVNVSCPNTKHGQETLLEEASIFFEILGELNIPLVPKINVLLPTNVASSLMDHPLVDALCVSNTIPFGELAHKIDWRKYSDKNGKSPLEKYGYSPGGLSGKPVFPIVLQWLKDFHKKRVGKPIIAGGGVMTKKNVKTLAQFKGVEAISVGTVALLRPWRVAGIIEQCYKSIDY